MTSAEHDAPHTRVLRHGGRVLLFDTRDRVLLLEDSDPSDPGRGSWWITPGGGLESGEDAAQAACRELREETGVVVPRVLGPIGSSEFSFTFHGVPTVQRDEFFHADAPESAMQEVRLTPAEQASLKGSRWWSLSEIEASSETVHPSRLSVFIRRALAQRTAQPPESRAGSGA